MPMPLSGGEFSIFLLHGRHVSQELKAMIVSFGEVGGIDRRLDTDLTPLFLSPPRQAGPPSQSGVKPPHSKTPSPSAMPFWSAVA
jgi:hypothetical protein